VIHCAIAATHIRQHSVYRLVFFRAENLYVYINSMLCNILQTMTVNLTYGRLGKNKVAQK